MVFSSFFHELMVSVLGWGGNTDEDNYFFWSGSKNYSWQPHEGCDERFDGLGSKIGPKPPPRYHFDWCNKNVVVPL